MIIFEPNYFTENYLKFDKNFKLEFTNNNLVVFAPNGTCKTTIYKTIKQKHEDFKFVDYEDLKDHYKKTIKKELIISPNIKQLEECKIRKKEIIANLNIGNTIKNEKITNKTHDKLVSNKFERTETFYENALLKFDKNNSQKLVDVLDKDSMFFAKNFNKFNAHKKIEINIQQLKNRTLKLLLKDFEEYLDETTMVCPICDSKKEKSILNLIKEKKDKLILIENELIDSYRTYSGKEIDNKILEKINKIMDLYENNDFSEDTIHNIIITGGDPEFFDLFASASAEIINLNKEIEVYENERDKFYEKLVDSFDKIKNIVHAHFNINSQQINIDNINKNLIINLDRDIDKYSTGEINLLILIINLYQFNFSDQEVLVLDDPLSSYDLVNQYRIIYELMNTASLNKKILLLTHNIEAISMLTAQYEKKFQPFYVEKSKDIVELNTISTNDNYTHLFNIETIINNNRQSPFVNYLKLLIKREGKEITDEEKNDVNQIFHYDSPHTFIDNELNYTFNNDYLVNLIEKFDDSKLKNTDFYENALNKIIYVVALRVWIEKQFYLVFKNDKVFPKSTLSNKIKYIFPKNKESKWPVGYSVSRDLLMGKKVMLNQNLHYKSQSTPFNFVLNISLFDIRKEILEIKKMFEKNT